MKWFRKLILMLMLILIVSGCGETTTQKGQETTDDQAKVIPVIPHKITKELNCAACHKNGTGSARATKHIDRPNCTQCHQVKIKK